MDAPPRGLEQVPSRVRDALGDLRARLAARFGDRLAEYRLFGSYEEVGHAKEICDSIRQILAAGNWLARS